MALIRSSLLAIRDSTFAHRVRRGRTRLCFDSQRVALTTFGNVTPRRPTIFDVAERAGVSKSLVSLIMRGATNVSDESRRAVLQAAEELGYRPNLVARNLAERRTRTLGVLVSDLHNPFFAVILDAMQSAAGRYGLRILMGTGRRDSAEE